MRASDPALWAKCPYPERESYGIHDLMDGGHEVTTYTEQAPCHKSSLAKATVLRQLS